MMKKKYLFGLSIWLLLTVLFSHAAFKKEKLFQQKLKLKEVKTKILQLQTTYVKPVEQIKVDTELAKLKEEKKNLKKSIEKLEKEVTWEKWRERGQRSRKWFLSWFRL